MLPFAAYGWDDWSTAKAKIPDGHVLVGQTPGGGYVIAKPFQEEYDRLVGQIRMLKAQILNRTIDEEEASGTLKHLQRQLQQAAARIQKFKEVVTAADLHTEQQTLQFEMGPQRCLLILAEKVKLVGWDKPHVECVLDKIVLSSGDDGDVAGHMQGLKLLHRHGSATQHVGETKEQWIQRLKGDAAELTDRQQQRVDDHVAWCAPLQHLQTKEIDVIEIQGLTWQQGNRQMQVELMGQEGGSIASQWRRHSNLTVFVPKCDMIGVLGGRKGIDVEAVDGSLGILGNGNKDYGVKSRISGLSGNLIARHIALFTVEDIGGDVDVERTAFEENSSSGRRGNTHTSYSGAPSTHSFRGIAGNLRVWFCRADVRFENIGGVANVRNDFGDTTFIAEEPLVKGGHRFVSESGRIEIRIPSETVEELSTVAVTECGVVKCSTSVRSLKSTNITGATSPDRARRRWSGFASSDFETFSLPARIDGVFSGAASQSSLNIVSRAGLIQLELTNE